MQKRKAFLAEGFIEKVITATAPPQNEERLMRMWLLPFFRQSGRSF
jgi:hypothetical protein